VPSTLDQRRTDAALPAIISARTTGPLAVSAVLGAALMATREAHAAGLALLAWSTVLLAQQCGPLLREASKRATGRWRAALFNLPFALFFLPALVWVLVTRPAFGGPAAGLAVGVTFGLVMQATEWKQWRLGFDRDLLELLPPVGPVLLLTQTWMLAGSAVFQELFYRGVLATILSGWNPATIIAASTLAFVFEHTSNRWATRAHSWRYYLRLTVLSVGLGFLATEVSLAAAVAAHLAFNAVPWASLFMRWRANPARAATQPSPAASA
jgi:hypothetical protein